MAVLLAGLVLVAQAADAAPRVQGEIIGVAPLAPGANFDEARGKAVVVVFPRSAEIDLELRRFPRPRGQAFIAWLQNGAGKFHIGGGFPRSFVRSGGSLVVPGSRTVAERRAIHARRLVITMLHRRKFKDIVSRAHTNGFKKALEVRGKRVVRGKVKPCSDGICPIDPFLRAKPQLD